MANECLYLGQTKQLGSLVEKLTTTGRPVLDDKLMKELKKICRTSDLCVEHVYHFLMAQLRIDHAEVRLSTSQIIDELFNRSHVFRELLLANFQSFLELTVETDQYHQPLPPPKAAAQKMKSDTLKAIQLWREKFGEAYKKLSLGYNYLQTCKHVNFSDIRAQSLAEQRRIEQQELRREQAMAAKLEKVRNEFSELQGEISDTAMEAENCIELLLPKPDLLFNDADFSTENTGNICVFHSRLSAQGPSSKHKKHYHDRENTSNRAHEGELAQVSSLSTDMNSGSPPEIDTHVDEFDNEDMDDNEENGIMQVHGLGSRKYKLQIEIERGGVRLQETEDNRDLFHNLKDAGSLISVRHLPQVVRWLEVMSKTGGTEAEIKKMIDLKVRLENIKTKCTEMQLVSQPQSQEAESSSDEEMEEVPEKEGYEPVIPAHLRVEYGLEPTPSTSSQLEPFSNKNSPSSSIRKTENKGTAIFSSTSSKSSSMASSSSSARGEHVKRKATAPRWNLKDRNKAALEQDPTSRAASLAKLGLQEDNSQFVQWPCTSSGKPATVTSETAGSIPIVSFGEDLSHWGAAPDQIEAPTIVKNDSLHRFWAPAQVENEKPSQSDIAAVLNRTFHFTGEFVPVKWKCRAKLPNGKLCERMDRIKCPFHGKIIPRDEMGVPDNPVDRQNEETAVAEVKSEPSDAPERELPPWLDAELQAEIEAATGHDLGTQKSRVLAEKAKGSKGKGKRKKKYEGLTDISGTKKSSRKRLEAKVFNKRSLKKVADVLDSADYKRVRDKFGNQFNYAYKN